ncbi:hypothetical protein NFI96_004057 [Prochilodus magdalenae]|nr:hypothetical protein NFI96_004057 [Prochilodus magdalenae]
MLILLTSLQIRCLRFRLRVRAFGHC